MWSSVVTVMTASPVLMELVSGRALTDDFVVTVTETGDLLLVGRFRG